MSRVFFDTNVLVYTVSAGNYRQSRAIDLVTAGGVISIQSLNEFMHVVLRKKLLDWDDAISAEREIIGMCEEAVPLTIDLHRRGLAVARKYKLALYDAMIVAAALSAGCDVLYSEYLHDGLVVDGALTIRNPFAPAG